MKSKGEAVEQVVCTCSAPSLVPNGKRGFLSHHAPELRSAFNCLLLGHCSPYRSSVHGVGNDPESFTRVRNLYISPDAWPVENHQP